MSDEPTMRERIAQAIHAKFVSLQPRPDDWPTWGELLAQGHQGANRVNDTRALADAVLAELETPTEAMTKAAAKYRIEEAATGWDAESADVWQAMIAEARKP
jgi:hypothetical protein